MSRESQSRRASSRAVRTGPWLFIHDRDAIIRRGDRSQSCLIHDGCHGELEMLAGAGGQNLRELDLSFWLPYPPSVNHYWTMQRKRMGLSKRALQYRKDAAAALVLQKVVRHQIASPVCVEVSVILPSDKRFGGDLDNLQKGPFDAIEAYGVLENDKWVKRFTVEELLGRRGRGLIWLRITQWEQEEPDADWLEFVADVFEG